MKLNLFLQNNNTFSDKNLMELTLKEFFSNWSFIMIEIINELIIFFKELKLNNLNVQTFIDIPKKFLNILIKKPRIFYSGVTILLIFFFVSLSNS